MFSENICITDTCQILKLWKSKAGCERQRWKENKVKFNLVTTSEKFRTETHLEWYSLWLVIMLYINRQIWKFEAMFKSGLSYFPAMWSWTSILDVYVHVCKMEINYGLLGYWVCFVNEHGIYIYVCVCVCVYINIFIITINITTI